MKMKRFILSKKILGIALCLFIPALAFTYSYDTCLGGKVTFPSNSITVRASNVSFPSGHSYTSALQSVINGLNNNPSNFRLTLQTGDTSVSLGNLQNETWFSSDDNLLDGAPAVAFSWSICTIKTESDVVYDSRRTWTSGTTKSSMTPYDGASRPFRNVVFHEFGHTFGLNHVATLYNILGQDWDHIHANGNTAYPYFGEDASNGAVFLYGKNASKQEDVAAVHWRRTGNSGEYSSHDRTRIFNNSGTVLTNASTGDEPKYLVDNGQTIQVEFTYENNGSDTHNNIPIGFYLSTNNTITTSDQRLGGRSINLGRNTVWTTSFTITLPNNLSPNTDYWVGVIVDENDAISEFRESNNATYTGIRTKNFTVPTATPTPTRTATPTRTPTPIRIQPTFQITPIVTLLPFATPTPTPTPRFTIPDIILWEELWKIRIDFYRINTVPLPKSLMLFNSDLEKPANVLPEYLLGLGSNGDSAPSVTLPDGTILTVARRGDDSSLKLIFITVDGDIGLFGELQPPNFSIGDQDYKAQNVSVLSMSYNGDNRVGLILKATGGDERGLNLFDIALRSTIEGPFRETSVRDFVLHE